MNQKIYEHAKSAREALMGLSTQDFLNFGLKRVAYVKEIEIDGKTAYAIHAADGTPLSLMENQPSAVAAVRQNDMEAVTVH